MSYASPGNEHWYVSVESGRKVLNLLGPYASHSDAAKHVERTRLAVSRLYPNDSEAHFAVYGVGRTITDTPRPGALTERIGV